MYDQNSFTACGYVCTSTKIQPRFAMSRVRQLQAIIEFCKLHSITLLDTYEESGFSGPDDQRPQFRAMMDRSTSDDRPYDLVIVHSPSRFTRDLNVQASSIGRLLAVRVLPISVVEHADRVREDLAWQGV